MRRAALLSVAGLALASPCTRSHPEGPSAPRPKGNGASSASELSLLCSANVDGHTEGLARRATLVDRVRAESRALFQVDAGDWLGAGSAEPMARQARLVLAAYARMGVDAITVGEQDLALGADVLQGMANAYGVPIVAANLVRSGGERVFPADRLIEQEGGPIGVFGILEPPAAPATSWSSLGLATTDPAEATRAEVASLRARGARVVVGLFHVAGGMARVMQIASRVGALDVIVLGHGRGDDAAVAHRGRRPIVADAGPPGASLTRIDVRARGRGLGLDEHTLSWTSEVPEQLGVGLLVWLDAAQVLNRPMGPLPPGGRAERWTYASNEACAFCHQTQVAQWATTAHAHAYATLRDTRRGTAPACLGCHMTGFLRPGGTQFIETATEQFADVGCESCHGPSADHVASMDKRRGTSRKVDVVICLGCHTPDQSIEPFNALKGMKDIVGPGHGLAVPAR
jgi:hypothetical protein